ncbi:hypothetical protein H4R18_005891 [Coemansia javaensis]|uniref:Core Histone H2A/H2B/H3 domain-containing protein n=1 Tax=Coemansia javaensis TaxID=2761396 RepID=A0A9W8H155_9FUNG|nr:hypothetical protein H4R18_005891 [Coemansia javaensis]
MQKAPEAGSSGENELGKFGLADATGYHHHPQSLASAVAAAVAQQQQQQQQQMDPGRAPAPMYPGASTIPTNFSSGQINSPEALQQFKANFWKAHTASIEDNTPDFKTHLLPLARIKKVMKSDPDVKVQMISAEAPILFSKACEIFITEITQRAWMNAEENKRRTLQRQDVSFAAQRSEMFDFLIDVVPREEFVGKKPAPGAREDAAGPAQAAAGLAQQPGQPLTPAGGGGGGSGGGSGGLGHAPQQAHPQGPQAAAHAQGPQPPQPPQPVGLYNDQAFHQYYAQHLADATGFPQAAGPTPEQRQAYYQQIEREQLQWLQRQANMGQFGGQRVGSASADSTNISPQIQQQQIQADSAADGDHGE